VLCGGIDLNQRRFRNFEAYFFSWMFISLWVQQSKLTSAAHRSGVIFLFAASLTSAIVEMTLVFGETQTKENLHE
jgi:hypothetical protein